MSAGDPGPVIGRRTTWIVCGALAVLFAVLSYSAVLTKSATYDEPYHMVGGFMRLKRGDYRFNVEDPALFGHFAALTLPDDAVQIPHPGRAEAAGSEKLMQPELTEQELYRDFPTKVTHQWILALRALYQTPGVDAVALIDRARLPFALLGSLLVLTVAWWAWRLGGGAAAIVAATLLAFDPNFLAHAPLLKNDVPITLLMVAMMCAIWRIGQRATVANAAALVLIVAVAFNVKYSGALFAPIMCTALTVRALLPAPWLAFGRLLVSRWRRLALVAALGAVTVLGTVGATWTTYGCRFAPHADPELRLDTDDVAKRVVHGIVTRRAYEMQQQGVPREQIIAMMAQGSELPFTVKFAQWLERHRVLPQAWINGFVYTYASSLIRHAFLLGELQPLGWHSYFPLAMWWKTPIATLAAVVLLPLWALALLLRRGWRPSAEQSWSIVCVGLAAVIYGLNAIMTNLNIGLRHVLPVYPFLFVTAAVSFAWLLSAWRRSSWLGVGLLLVLAVESTTAYPHYLPFFNQAAGGSRGGLDLLSDSNLDWGQDLKELAAWRSVHRDAPLFVSYFGFPDPRWSVADATLLPGGFVGGSVPPISTFQAGAYIAISASCLQGTYLEGGSRTDLRNFIKKQQLVTVLGGSIYVYRVLPA